MVTSHTWWCCRIEIPKSWILQRPINGKTTPPVAMVGRKWKRQGGEQNPSGGVTQKSVKSLWIEVAISRLFMASIGGFPGAFQRKGWHRDNQQLKSFRSVPSSTETVARNRRSGRVTLASRIGSGSLFPLSLCKLFFFLFFSLYKGLGKSQRKWGVGYYMKRQIFLKNSDINDKKMQMKKRILSSPTRHTSRLLCSEFCTNKKNRMDFSFEKWLPTNLKQLISKNINCWW